MKSAIEHLNERLTKMEENFKRLKEELDKSSGNKLDVEFEAMKRELSTLSQYATTDTQERHKKLDKLHRDLAAHAKPSNSAGSKSIDGHLEKLGEATSRALDGLQTQQRRMFGTSVFAIAFVVIAGLGLYCKFRGWEKKHVL